MGNMVEKQERLDAALEKAQDAFWAAIGAAYPEIKTGDLDPWTTFHFEDACRVAARNWVLANGE